MNLQQRYPFQINISSLSLHINFFISRELMAALTTEGDFLTYTLNSFRRSLEARDSGDYHSYFHRLVAENVVTSFYLVNYIRAVYRVLRNRLDHEREQMRLLANIVNEIIVPELGHTFGIIYEDLLSGNHFFREGFYIPETRSSQRVTISFVPVLLLGPLSNVRSFPESQSNLQETLGYIYTYMRNLRRNLNSTHRTMNLEGSFTDLDPYYNSNSNEERLEFVRSFLARPSNMEGVVYYNPVNTYNFSEEDLDRYFVQSHTLLTSQHLECINIYDINSPLTRELISTCNRAFTYNPNPQQLRPNSLLNLRNNVFRYTERPVICFSVLNLYYSSSNQEINVTNNFFVIDCLELSSNLSYLPNHMDRYGSLLVESSNLLRYLGDSVYGDYTVDSLIEFIQRDLEGLNNVSISILRHNDLQSHNLIALNLLGSISSNPEDANSPALLTLEFNPFQNNFFEKTIIGQGCLQATRGIPDTRAESLNVYLRESFNMIPGMTAYNVFRVISRLNCETNLRVVIPLYIARHIHPDFAPGIRVNLLGVSPVTLNSYNDIPRLILTETVLHVVRTTRSNHLLILNSTSSGAAPYRPYPTLISNDQYLVNSFSELRSPEQLVVIPLNPSRYYPTRFPFSAEGNRTLSHSSCQTCSIEIMYFITNALQSLSNIRFPTLGYLDLNETAFINRQYHFSANPSTYQPVSTGYALDLLCAWSNHLNR